MLADMSRRDLAKRKRRTGVTIPERVSPHVKLAFSEMQRQNCTYDDVQDGSGVLRCTLKAWRHKNRPSLESLEAVLGFLNFDFVPIPRAKIVPLEIIAELQPIAHRLGLAMPQAIQYLTQIAVGIEDRRRPARGVRNMKAPAPIGSEASKLLQPVT
ncbi:hypothetical protein [Aureimonas psammosilenae]|uniref:hypothetical protein n=1 Tax=Aureimonas psammosilenae TaxID=2495496 RepID=UPI00186A4831|nr:hypothetical protein [Aureimonas psammosilenae]